MNNIYIYLLIIILIIIILKNIVKKKCFNNELFSNSINILKYNTLITYVYYETEETKKNLTYFIKNGIINNKSYTYLLIINNYECTVDIPQNIFIIKKENSYDLEAYNVIFNQKYFNIKDYKYFIFINSSCIGPFIPTYCNNWITCFTDLINDNVKLVGPIIENNGNYLGYKAFINFNSNINIDNLYSDNVPFIHSYMFVTDDIGLSLLKKYNIFEKVTSKYELITVKEYLLSSCILYNNYNIKSLLLKYKNINWLDKNTDYFGDPEIPNNYDQIDINPFEVIFIKNIRNVNEFRNDNIKGISTTLNLYLTKYLEWNNN